MALPLASSFELSLGGEQAAEHGLIVTVEGIQVDDSELQVSSREVPGRSGVVDTTLTNAAGQAFTGMRKLTIPLLASGSVEDVQAAKSWLGGLHGKMISVSWLHLLGHYEGRCTVGGWHDVYHGQYFAYSTVSLSVNVSPYTRLAKFVVTGDTNISVFNSGNTPCWAAYTINLQQPSSSCYLSVKAHDGDAHYVGVDMGTSITGEIVINTDPARRGITIAGNPVAATLGSDFTPLTPGRNDVACMTAGRVSCAFQPLLFT